MDRKDIFLDESTIILEIKFTIVKIRINAFLISVFAKMFDIEV